MTTLRDAILMGDLEKVRKLIAGGADVCTPLEDGTTPIQLAARQAHVDIVRALAHAGADPRDLAAVDLHLRLALFLKTAKEEPTDGEDLLDVGELIEWLMEMTDDLDQAVDVDLALDLSPLFRAVVLGRSEEVRARIAAGDDVNEVREVHQDTPLLAAIKRGHEQIFLDLLAAGANVELADSWGRPLRHAFRNLRFTKHLIDAGAEINRPAGRYGFLESVIKESLENYVPFPQDPALVVRLLLEAGAEPIGLDRHSFLLQEIGISKAWEIYHEVLPHCPAKAVRDAERFLEPKEEDPQSRAFNASIELRQGVLTGDLEKMRSVLASGDVDVDDQGMGGTALMQAASSGRVEVMRLLIESGADLHAVDPSPMTWRGSTALARAAESFDGERVRAAVALLVDAGADVDQRGAHGRTALVHAIATAHRRDASYEAVGLLLAAGADPDLEDDFGYNAWAMAEYLLVNDRERVRAPERPRRDSIYWDDRELAEALGRCRKIRSVLEQAGAAVRDRGSLELLGAVRYGNARRVKRLLAAGTDPNVRDPDGDPAIVIAAEKADDASIAHLIDAGCEVDAVGIGCPWTALERVLRRGRTDSIRRLLAAGADPIRIANLDPDDEYAALRVAERAGHIEAVHLVRRALPPEALAVKPPPEPTEEEKARARADILVREASWGNLAGVRDLLASGEVDVDAPDIYGRTPLSAAAEAGKTEVMELLIEAGADADLVIHRTVGSRANPRSTPLAAAAIGPSAERGRAIRVLLEAGADVDRTGTDGRTALMHAVERDVGFFGRTGEGAVSTRALIEAGANLDVRDRYGLTAWMRALSLADSIDIPEISEQYRTLARLLEEAGASTERRCDLELTREAAGPPWVAMETYREPAAEDTGRLRELLRQGASPDARRHDGATALILAVRGGRARVASLLISAGCDLNARHHLDHGPTALIEAAWNGHLALVRLLHEAGADKSLCRDPDRPSSTAGALAASRHYDRIARLLGEPRPRHPRREPWDMFGLFV